MRFRTKRAEARDATRDFGGRYPNHTFTATIFSGSVVVRRMFPSFSSRTSVPVSATMKLAWRSLTKAPPMRVPFNPACSIIAPAETPRGSLNTRPAH